MRVLIRTMAVVSAFALPSLVPAATALAQGASGHAEPKQITLTQKQVDGVIAAQKDIRSIEEKVPQSQGDRPDPKIDAQLAAVAKKNGFPSLASFSDASSSIGLVMAGIDPETKKYVGPAAVLKEQIAEIKGDKKMPPKEQKEQVDELNEALKSASTEKPLPGNIDLVTTNYDKLTTSMQPAE